ncbi:MAG: MG2 domain-containing protein [Gammaproteobacteria bacterium]
MYRSVLGSLLALVLLSVFVPAAFAEPQVESFAPQGTVKGVRQVAARFSEPMVPFGDPRLSEPFAIDCPEAGKGRWADARNFVYDFERDLPAGVRCSFTLKPELRTLDGKPLTGTQLFSFSTGGPAVRLSAPYEGAGNIDEEQVFVLGLDAGAVAASIEEHVHCAIEGIAERVGVRLLAGEERKGVIEGRRGFLRDYANTVGRDGGAEADPERLRAIIEGEDSPIVVLQCQRRFPNAVDVRLVWGKGVTSKTGIATEEDQTLAFEVRDEFRARFSCERVKRDRGCIPFLPLSLSFSTPITRADAEAITLEDVDGTKYGATVPGDPRVVSIDDVSFTGPFPEQSTFTLTIPQGLQDDAGRTLANQKSFPLKVETDEVPPLVKFPATFGIVELHADAALPVTLRNLEALLPLLPLPAAGTSSPPLASLPDAKADPEPEPASGLTKWWQGVRERLLPEPSEVQGRRLRVEDSKAIPGWMRRVVELQEDKGHYDYEADKYIVERRAGEKSLFDAAQATDVFKLPKPLGRRAFEVIGIPFERPGFYVVELASPRLGAALYGKVVPFHAQTAVLVTNLGVHLKLGRESSLVWVTSLDHGRPVAGAEVVVSDCEGKVYFEGKTGEDGIVRIAETLPRTGSLPECLPWRRAFFVTARSGEDQSFAMSDWSQGISPWRFNLPTASYTAPNLVSTVFDRTLVRAGETVHMKHFARRHLGTGISLIDPSALPEKLVVRHQGSDQEYTLRVAWDAQGIAESQFEVPKDAKQGSYRVSASLARPGQEGTVEVDTGGFKVESFRVPTMKAILKPLETDLVDAGTAEIDIQLNYLGGGGAREAPVKLRGLVRPKSVTFPDHEGFEFANGDVAEGEETEDPDAEQREGGDGATPLATQSLTLDRAGAARARLDGLPKSATPQDVLAELEYQDANGERLTAATHLNLWPARLVVGLKPDGWALSRERLRAQALVLDLQGRPVRAAKVEVDVLTRITYSHRKRLVGGFYAYEHHREVKRVGPLCAGETDDKGLFLCESKSPADGNLILRARVIDADGNPSHANREVWVAKSGDWWFEQGNEDRMDLIPEKKRYEPGETAVFQVRMPFREATALVCVEREGVIEHFIRPLSGKAPVVEVPVQGHYAPNVFVSVLAVRGRVRGVEPTALIDLGKPAFKLGIAEIKVGWRAHELKVGVTADKESYQVRDKAQVDVRVQRADGGTLPAGGEVALAAVDEGLLELMPNDSWDLLQAMMGRRGIEVETSTAQMQVIGKRHYGRKALPHGGGGGRQAARELFDTLLLWKGRMKLDERGEARIEVPLNDSLTSFRIVAVASAASDLFGSGGTAVRTTQDLMLISGLPPVVREEDRFRGGFTVRNATEYVMEVSLAAQVLQSPAAGAPQALGGPLPPLSLSLDPGEAQEAAWEVTAPLAARQLLWEIEASSRDASDRLRVSQRVIEAVPVRVYQATLFHIEGAQSLVTGAPEDAVPGRGGVRVILRRSLAEELSGVHDYMSRYPYNCLEQRVSKAIALGDKTLWQSVAGDLPAYLDTDGLLKYFPSLVYGSDVLTAYVLTIAHEAGWVIPEDARNKMREALVQFVQGKVSRNSALPTADLALRKLAALEAAARYQAIEPTLLDSITIEPNLWPTSAVLDWLNVLGRTVKIPERAARLEAAKQILRSRLNFQGTTMGFSTEGSDDLFWLMQSADANANRAILALIEDRAWREDLPRMVRGSLGRQRQAHWDTTLANAWGVLAMERFRRAFEAEPIAGVTSTELGVRQEFVWSPKSRGGSLDHPWPPAPQPLAIEHRGTGRPWAMVQSLAAIPLKKPLSSGYRITRTVTPIERQAPERWSRGDVLRVTLALEAQSDMTWVVVNDPIPSGATILGTGLGLDSQVMSTGERREGEVYPAFEERTFDAFRAYYEYVPKGKWTVEYTFRLNNAGEFQLPETRVEALYAPEMFGALPNGALSVAP